jgi:hypothetical protein
MHSAWVRVEAADMDEEDVEKTGRLFGVNPLGRRFEFGTDDGVVKGLVGESFSEIYLERIQTDGAARAQALPRAVSSPHCPKIGRDQIETLTLLVDLNEIAQKLDRLLVSHANNLRTIRPRISRKTRHQEAAKLWLLKMSSPRLRRSVELPKRDDSVPSWATTVEAPGPKYVRWRSRGQVAGIGTYARCEPHARGELSAIGLRRATLVPMMEPADLWNGGDPSDGWADRT